MNSKCLFFYPLIWLSIDPCIQKQLPPKRPLSFYEFWIQWFGGFKDLVPVLRPADEQVIVCISDFLKILDSAQTFYELSEVIISNLMNFIGI